jgi:hypothetical protein
VFGTAGAFATSHGWHGLVAVAVPGAALFAEGVALFSRGAEDRWMALIAFALGVLVIGLTARGARQRILALLAAVPLALLWLAALTAAGIR